MNLALLLVAFQTPSVHVSGHAALALTRVDPIPQDRALTELRVVHPVIMARFSARSVALIATANLEGLTLPNGELVPGAWGEGFVDRRHPHTYAHEIVIEWRQAAGPVRLGIAAGKGFAPFGTDDPMMRPPLRYPVNHHFSQILERAIVTGSVALGSVSLEAGVFNGDEPEHPRQWPNLDRFGDSWSARATVLPAHGLEMQASVAQVHSPEHRLGAAGDQWKWSASVRWDRALGARPVAGLIEWARTSELDGFFVFQTFLVEGAITLGRHQPYMRIESTERPEEARTLDLFRSQRPHLENSILGITRWDVITAGYALTGPRCGPVALRPLLEASRARVTSVTGGVFDPESFYGSRTVWSVTLGLRLDVGMLGHRMGRYGVHSLAPPPNSHTH